MEKPILFIAADHAGWALKTELKKRFPEIDWHDLGTESEASVDYPDYADRLAMAVKRTPGGRGVLICGTGQGMAIRANRHPEIRAALCWSPEIAALSRQHNDANVLCLSGRFIALEVNARILESFLGVAYEGGRHEKRVGKLSAPLGGC
jgi:ribose 5-phosphate isomerase B